jgi:hypothetical protein
MVELYRRRVWTDARTVNVIASACLSGVRSVACSVGTNTPPYLPPGRSVLALLACPHAYARVCVCVRVRVCGVCVQSTRLVVIGVNFFLGIEQKMADDEDGEAMEEADAHKLEVHAHTHTHTGPPPYARRPYPPTYLYMFTHTTSDTRVRVVAGGAAADPSRPP